MHYPRGLLKKSYEITLKNTKSVIILMTVLESVVIIVVFKTKRFEAPDKNSSVKKQQTILFNSTRSIFDIKYADIAAQYASPNETPLEKMGQCKNLIVRNRHDTITLCSTSVKSYCYRL